MEVKESTIRMCISCCPVRVCFDPSEALLTIVVEETVLEKSEEEEEENKRKARGFSTSTLVGPSLSHNKTLANLEGQRK
jgi:hypothetical protein